LPAFAETGFGALFSEGGLDRGGGLPGEGFAAGVGEVDVLRTLNLGEPGGGEGVQVIDRDRAPKSGKLGRQRKLTVAGSRSPCQHPAT